LAAVIVKADSLLRQRGRGYATAGSRWEALRWRHDSGSGGHARLGAGGAVTATVTAHFIFYRSCINIKTLRTRTEEGLTAEVYEWEAL
jgi:hypothetical protein